LVDFVGLGFACLHFTLGTFALPLAMSVQQFLKEECGLEGFSSRR